MKKFTLRLWNSLETAAGLIGAANAFDGADEWVQLSPLGDFPHARGTQRIDRTAMSAMVNHFNSLRARLSRRFGGLPFFIGHPDVPALANEYSDQKAYGWVQELETREDGLYGRVKWSEPGKQLLANAHYKFLSPHWNAKEATEAGQRVLRPVELVSVGLTNKPNLPVNPLANSSPEGQEEIEEIMEKAVLIALLQLANDATEEQIKAKITGLANAQTEKATAETALSNERSAHSGTKTSFEQQLANEQQKFNTQVGLFNTEREERIKLLLANAIREGRITKAQEGTWLADLKADFEGKSVALANAKRALHTAEAARSNGLGARRVDPERLANEQSRRDTVASLVNAKTATGMSYEAAWLMVQRENPELFAAMQTPGN